MPLFPPQDYRKTAFTHRRGLAASRPAAADVLPGTLYFSTDTNIIERSTGSAWESFSGTGNGNVTTSATLTANRIILGNGGVDVTLLGSLGTTTTVLHGNAAGAPSFSAVSLSADVTGTLPVDNGGTGIATLAVNRIPYGNGISPFQSASNFTFDGTTFTTPGQIAFPSTQNPSSNANTLDDYEEGTWTPVIGGSGGESGQTYNFQTGWYVKIGKLVHIGFNVDLSAKGTITGSVEIHGLPFTAANVANQNAYVLFGWDDLATAYVQVSGFVILNTTIIVIRAITAASTTSFIGTSITTANINNGTQFAGIASYIATD